MGGGLELEIEDEKRHRRSWGGGEEKSRGEEEREEEGWEEERWERRVRFKIGSRKHSSASTKAEWDRGRDSPLGNRRRQGQETNALGRPTGAEAYIPTGQREPSQRQPSQSYPERSQSQQPRSETPDSPPRRNSGKNIPNLGKMDSPLPPPSPSKDMHRAPSIKNSRRSKGNSNAIWVTYKETPPSKKKKSWTWLWPTSEPTAESGRRGSEEQDYQPRHEHSNQRYSENNEQMPRESTRHKKRDRNEKDTYRRAQPEPRRHDHRGREEERSRRNYNVPANNSDEDIKPKRARHRNDRPHASDEKRREHRKSSAAMPERQQRRSHEATVETDDSDDSGAHVPDPSHRARSMNEPAAKLSENARRFQELRREALYVRYTNLRAKHTPQGPHTPSSPSEECSTAYDGADNSSTSVGSDGLQSGDKRADANEDDKSDRMKQDDGSTLRNRIRATIRANKLRSELAATLDRGDIRREPQAGHTNSPSDPLVAELKSKPAPVMPDFAEDLRTINDKTKVFMGDRDIREYNSIKIFPGGGDSSPVYRITRNGPAGELESDVSTSGSQLGTQEKVHADIGEPPIRSGGNPTQGHQTNSRSHRTRQHAAQDANGVDARLAGSNKSGKKRAEYVAAEIPLWGRQPREYAFVKSSRREATAQAEESIEETPAALRDRRRKQADRQARHVPRWDRYQHETREKLWSPESSWSGSIESSSTLSGSSSIECRSTIGQVGSEYE